MHINFIVNPVAGGWEYNDKRLGGSEESVVAWASELIKKGHDISVYYNNHSGNNYSDYEPADVAINVKYPKFETKEPTLYLTNEVDASKHDLSRFKGVVWPSKWAEGNIPVNNKTFVVPHGYYPDKIYPGKKIRRQCFYASSPDRGLDTLLRVWPDIHNIYPDTTLILTYGALIGNHIPGVINLGTVDEETMDEIYRTSQYWLYPCTGNELYCITGQKAQAAGCIPVIIPHMALSETVRYGFMAIDERAYYQALKNALEHSDKSLEDLREKMVKDHYPTWEDSTNDLLNVINKVL